MSFLHSQRCLQDILAGGYLMEPVTLQLSPETSLHQVGENWRRQADRDTGVQGGARWRSSGPPELS
jgi:hypothetical protein